MFPGSFLASFAAIWLTSLLPVLVFLAAFGVELARVVYLSPMICISADEVTENRRMGNIFVFVCLAIAGAILLMFV